MDKGGKVVPIDPRNAPRLDQQRILQRCKQVADQYVEGLFKQVVDKLDDVLFGIGNKGGADASTCLDAARELRLKRQDIASLFLDKFAHCYQARLDYAAFSASSAKKESAQGSSLSLVDEQDLEESLAIDGLSAKANDRFRNELYALAQRFNALVDGAQYSENMQPLSPDTMSSSFRDAFQEMKWKIETKLITYKIFEQNVMRSLGEFYRELNTLLGVAGVLPGLKLGIAINAAGGAAQDRSPRVQGSEVPASSAAHHFLDDGMQLGMQGGETAVDVYQTLQQLMNARKYGGVSAGGAPGGSASGGFSMPGSGIVMGPSLLADDLVRGLSLLQHNPLSAAPGGAINVAAIKNALLEQMQQVGDARGINPAHDNTIDVIGMIFEFILDEPSIPDVVKTLLNRMQIPILKIALADKEFFTNRTNAARRLLNVLGHAGIGWSENKEEARQRRFQKMEYVVNRVLAEFEQDPSIFAALLDEFTEFLVKEGDDAVEELSPLGEAQDVSPERQAFEAVEGRLAGVEIPDVLRDFLRNIWRNVLQHVLDGEGYGSEGWRRCEQSIDELIWSVQPKTAADERRKMVTSLPRLLDSLREGMSLVGGTQQDVDAVIDALEPIHMACLRGEVFPVKEHKAEQAAKAPDTAKGSSADVAELIRSIREEVRGGAGQKTTEQGDSIADDADDLDDASVGDASSFAIDQAEAVSADDNVEDEFTALAAEMSLGAWLEFAMDGKKRRGKLAWKSVVMGEYVFVDRRYKVVAEKTLAQLAADLRYGRAAPLEDVPMFDRALDKVLNGLMTSGSAAH